MFNTEFPNQIYCYMSVQQKENCFNGSEKSTFKVSLIITHQLKQIHPYHSLPQTSSTYWYSKDKIPQSRQMWQAPRYESLLARQCPSHTALCPDRQRTKDEILRKIFKGDAVVTLVIKDDFTSFTHLVT